MISVGGLVAIESLEGTNRCGALGKTGLPGYDSHLHEVRHLIGVAVLHCCAIQALSGTLSGLRDPDRMKWKEVGALMGPHRETVSGSGKTMMEKVRLKRSLDGITILGFDEISGGKGANVFSR